MKRIFLFIATNLAVVLLLSVVASALGVDQFLTQNGLNLETLLWFSLVMGFGGSFISLLISKQIALWSTGAHIIKSPEGAHERWLVDTVRRLADKANIGMPDVAVYEGAPNAFATGAFKNSALVAVSTGLLESMSRDEVEAVLGHEVTHVANGDMVTLTLIQGVLNTFVFFLSRVVGFIVDRTVFRTERGIGPGYYITVIVSQIVFGILAAMIVMWFSRQREFRADAGSARLLGTPQPMIGALMRLGGMQPGALPQSLAAAGVNGAPGWAALFSSHPPIEERIAALQGRT
ncbi:MAG: protease HtpX [Betaproteobacteria bacterium]|nr:MAG: protease HtpX [Betaproteobacteria bacterium]TMH67930.1 MAG: protease HtpX [Betaproteobacteria bacterium]